MKDLSKLRKYPLKGFALLETFRTGKFLSARILNGFPKDAEVIHHRFDREANEFILTVHSEEFESVPQGGDIPFGVVTVTEEVLPSAKAILHLGQALGNPAVTPEEGETVEMAIVKVALELIDAANPGMLVGEAHDDTPNNPGADL